MRCVYPCAWLGREGDADPMVRAMCRESQSLVAFAMLDEGAGSKIVTGSVSCGAHLLQLF